MREIYRDILDAKSKKQKLLAILLDPEKLEVKDVDNLISKLNKSPATHILVGGSSFKGKHLDDLIVRVKEKTKLPVVLFPGHPSQISTVADGILFLQLLSGKNPEYLIEHQINAIPVLEKSNLEIISTAYLLVESGNTSAVERVSKTKPLPRVNSDYVSQVAKAGEWIGNKLVYLEAGSGAKNAVPLEMIKTVSERITIPLIVGGGIRSQKKITEVFDAGADMVVIGTAFENDVNFFQIK